MPLPGKKRPEPPSDQVLREVAELAGVPSEQHDFYADCLRDIVQTACDRHGLMEHGLSKKQGDTLLSSALTMYETLGELTEDQRTFMNSVLDPSHSLCSIGFQRKALRA